MLLGDEELTLLFLRVTIFEFFPRVSPLNQSLWLQANKAFDC